jgi:phage tail sheath protein FI
MATYRTPGVYVEEISTLPPSVAEVATAVPAFIGYTEAGRKMARVTSMLEFEASFGKAKPTAFIASTVRNVATGLDELQEVKPQTSGPNPDFLLYYAISHYFKNGGGPCYIVSVGDYSKAPAKAAFFDGLALIAKEDEPTLIVLTDAVLLTSPDYMEVAQEALAQCDLLTDRFVILDVPGGDVDGFRNGIGTDHLSYAAAYHPYLETTLTFAYDEAGVQVKPGTVRSEGAFPAAGKGIRVAFTGVASPAPSVTIQDGDADLAKAVTFVIAAGNATLTIGNTKGRTGTQVADAWSAWTKTNRTEGFEVAVDGDGTAVMATASAKALQAAPVAKTMLVDLKTTQTALYNSIKDKMSSQRVTLPPSAAIAGIYAQVDRDRGVWKAPANVSVCAVVGPTVRITDADQEGLNVDPTAGKSINAIRAFNGMGTRVWGARTLAGNDNEWRYVPVRRLFITIEESTKKASAFAVFEPNDASTWLKVKGMIESYLYELWQRGALAGSTADAAYYVSVGLGKTMTSQDVLEGRMIVDIGVAAVRPAEFIVLRFTHKLQES